MKRPLLLLNARLIKAKAAESRLASRSISTAPSMSCSSAAATAAAEAAAGAAAGRAPSAAPSPASAVSPSGGVAASPGSGEAPATHGVAAVNCRKVATLAPAAGRTVGSKAPCAAVSAAALSMSASFPSGGVEASPRRITSRGRKRGRYPPRCGLGRYRHGQAGKGEMLELAADQSGPLHGGQERRLGSGPFYDAAAAYCGRWRVERRRGGRCLWYK